MPAPTIAPPPGASGAGAGPATPVVSLRPQRPGEQELVARFFNGLSAESRRRRFLQPMPRLPEALLARLAAVDGRRHVAVVAEAGGEVAGLGRFVAVADQPGTAEVAVTVADRFQGRGIGRLLLAALDQAAERSGVEVLVYLVDPTNRRMLRLLRGLGVELRLRDGLVEGRQRPGRRDPAAAGAPPVRRSGGRGGSRGCAG